MPTVDIIDEVFVVAERGAVRARCCDAAQWSVWFPELALTTYEDRGLKGVRWRLDGSLVGTAEVWLEEFGDGTIVHTYLRADPGRPVGNDRRTRAWAIRHYALPLKAHLLEVKQELEAGREPGTTRVPLADRVVSPEMVKARRAARWQI